MDSMPTDQQPDDKQSHQLPYPRSPDEPCPFLEMSAPQVVIEHIEKRSVLVNLIGRCIGLLDKPLVFRKKDKRVIGRKQIINKSSEIRNLENEKQAQKYQPFIFDPKQRHEQHAQQGINRKDFA